MARLILTGFETGALESEGQGCTGTGVGATFPTVSSAVARSGSFSMRSTGDTKTGTSVTWAFSGATATTYYSRHGFYVDTQPDAGVSDTITLFGTGAVTTQIRLKDTALGLYIGGSLVGSTAAVSLATWYVVELAVKINSGAADDYAEFRLDGSSIGSTTTATIAVAGPANFNVGHQSTFGSGTQPIYYFDDVAVNDSTGANENSWCGGSSTNKIVLLKPISDNARVGFVGGAGATTNLFDAVNNYPPIGKATGPNSTDLTQIESPNNNATDTYDANTAAYTTAIGSGGGGLGASDAIAVAQAIADGGNGSDQAGGRTLAVNALSNPGPGTEGTAQTSATKVGIWPADWVSLRSSPVYAPSPTLGSSAVVRVRKGTASTQIMTYDMMGLYVEYTPTVVYTGGIPNPVLTPAVEPRLPREGLNVAKRIDPVVAPTGTPNPPTFTLWRFDQRVLARDSYIYLPETPSFQIGKPVLTSRTEAPSKTPDPFIAQKSYPSIRPAAPTLTGRDNPPQSNDVLRLPRRAPGEFPPSRPVLTTTQRPNETFEGITTGKRPSIVGAVVTSTPVLTTYIFARSALTITTSTFSNFIRSIRRHWHGLPSDPYPPHGGYSHGLRRKRK